MPATVRTALITGATSGIGLETARRLAALDTTVVLHARTTQDGERAVEELVKTGADPLRLRVAVADFTCLAQVADLAAQVAADHPRLDLLVNNAATIGPDGRVLTGDGNELALQVNYLAPYLLTRLLWRPLTAAPGSRVINLSSSLHRSGHLHWGDLNYNRRYARVSAYAQSKLAITMFTKALSEYGENGLLSAAVHPGVVETALVRIYGRTEVAPVGEGASSVVHLSDPGSQIHSGDYYVGLTPAEPAPLVRDRAAIRRLWRLSAKLTGIA